MTPPTPATFAEAKRLVASIAAKSQRIANLHALIDAAKTNQAAQHYTRAERLDFYSHPERLAGAVEFYRRTDPETRRLLPMRYHMLLADMLEAPLPGMKPRKVDYDALPPAARPYLLAPYLQLDIGTAYPRLCLDRSEPTKGRVTYISAGGAIDVTAWQQSLSKIDAWLGGSWAVDAHTATTITLIRRTPLPDVIPFNPAWLKDQHLFLGIDIATHSPFYVPLKDMTHTLVCGTTGMGKSNGLHVLVRSLLHNIRHFEHVHLVCGKGGVAFRRYTGIHPKVSTWSEPDDLWKLTADLVATMKARNARMAAEGRDNTFTGYIALVIDEFGAFNSCDDPDKKSEAYKAHQTFLANMMHLGKRGRSAGIRLILTVQEPTDRDILSGIRNVLPSTLAFRLPMVQHATAVFGELGGLPVDVRRLRRGIAIIRTPNDIHNIVINIPILHQCRDASTQVNSKYVNAAETKPATKNTIRNL